MPPERTGRKNRSIHSRSDAYVLDGTPYEMLNGNLPITASDPVEWLHCHIARHLVSPHDRAKSAPACVFVMVMKLGAKTPEERYQTAFGVESDLRRRVAECEPYKYIADVPPVHDAADCLLILARLYGRARELAIPLMWFSRLLAGGSELVLGSGYSRIGESAIVNESPRPLVPEFTQQQTQRRFQLAGAVLGILSRFLFGVLLPFSGEPTAAGRLTLWSSEQ